MDKAVIYIHGKGGNAEEAIHYKPLFSNCDVIGLDYKLFWYCYPNIIYKWVTYVKKYGGWIDYDECKKLRNEEKKRKKMEEK